MSLKGRWHARLQAMSPREKGLLVACFVVGVGIAATKWAILPAHEEYTRNRDAIRRQIATIARYETARQGQDRVDAERFRQVDQLRKWEEGLLAGETASAAGVFLQGVLKPLTENPDTRVTSIRGLPPVRKGAYSEVAVQLDIQTSTEGLARLLADISRQPKFLQVRMFSAGTGGNAGRPLPRKEVVVVSMVVAGLSSASPDGKGVPGGGEP
jgi:hypothetical protein